MRLGSAGRGLGLMPACGLWIAVAWMAGAFRNNWVHACRMTTLVSANHHPPPAPPHPGPTAKRAFITYASQKPRTLLSPFTPPHPSPPTPLFTTMALIRLAVRRASALRVAVSSRDMTQRTDPACSLGCEGNTGWCRSARAAPGVVHSCRPHSSLLTLAPRF